MINTTSTLLFISLILISLVQIINGLQCFDCYGTGPDHKECTEQRTCNGVACMIFDAGDNKTASAFCLLAMKDKKIDEAKDGCWLEPDGKGKHCMCFSDYCNKLIDRRNTDETDPMAPLLPTAEFLKQNPLVDYDAPNLGDYVDQQGSHPAPKHVLFPSADRQDPRVAGGDDSEDDLVPVEFEDYKDVQEEEETKHHHHHHKYKSTTSTTTAEPSTSTPEGVALPDPDDSDDSDEMDELNTIDDRRREMARIPNNRDRQQHENEISGHYKPPSWVLLVFPMAASMARFVAAV